MADRDMFDRDWLHDDRNPLKTKYNSPQQLPTYESARRSSPPDGAPYRPRREGPPRPGVAFGRRVAWAGLAGLAVSHFGQVPWLWQVGLAGVALGLAIVLITYGVALLDGILRLLRDLFRKPVLLAALAIGAWWLLSGR